MPAMYFHTEDSWQRWEQGCTQPRDGGDRPGRRKEDAEKRQSVFGRARLDVYTMYLWTMVHLDIDERGKRRDMEGDEGREERVDYGGRSGRGDHL